MWEIDFSDAAGEREMAPKCGSLPRDAEELVGLIDAFTFLAHSKNELMQWRGVRRLSVNFCTNRFFSQINGWIATKLAHDGLQVSMHPGCAQGQGQGQRSRDTRTFLDSWNKQLLRH